MKKNQLFLIEFILFVYTNYIVEEWDIFTKWGKIFIYPLWFYRACVIWLISPIFLPEFFFKRSKLYKEIQKLQNSKEFQTQMAMMSKHFNMPM